ncbi:MAG: hypothetical protein ACON5B_04320 [Myxococcota bacterium]
MAGLDVGEVMAELEEGADLTALDLADVIARGVRVGVSPASSLCQLAEVAAGLDIWRQAVGASRWKALWKIFLAALEASPADGDVLMCAGRIALQQAQLEERDGSRRKVLRAAQNLAQQAIELAPDAVAPRLLRGRILYEDEEADLQHALADFRTAVSAQPEHALSQAFLGHALLAAGDCSAACEAFAAVERTHTTLTESERWRRLWAREHHGMALLELGQDDAAEAVFAELVATLLSSVQGGEIDWEERLGLYEPELLFDLVESGDLPALAPLVRELRHAMIS